MKKFFLILGMCLFVVGCQPKEVKKETINLQHTYTIDEQLEYAIQKTQVTNRITPSNKNKDYKYIDSKDDHQFIDVIVKTKNLTEGELNITNLFGGTFRMDGQSYDVKVAIETENYTQISTTDSLKSGQSRYVHVYCEVPQTTSKEEVTLELEVMKDRKYQYTFQTEEPVIDNDIKSVGDTLSFKQSSIHIKNLSQSKKVEPSQKGFFYSYIPVDNQNETFIILQLEVKNITDQAFDPSEYLYCEYKVEGKTIKSNVIVESDNNQSISKTGTIKAGQNRIVYLTMSIEDSLLNKASQIQLFVEGETIIVQK